MHFGLKIFKVVKVRVIIFHFVVNMKMNMVNKRSNPHISPMIIEMSKLCLKILFICFTFSPIFAVSFFSIFLIFSPVMNLLIFHNLGSSSNPLVLSMIHFSFLGFCIFRRTLYYLIHIVQFFNYFHML